MDVDDWKVIYLMWEANAGQHLMMEVLMHMHVQMAWCATMGGGVLMVIWTETVTRLAAFVCKKVRFYTNS